MNGTVIKLAPRLATTQADGLGNVCGIPLDSQHFDASGVVDMPTRGRQVILARFELPPQYCGQLENFSQFTDAFAHDQSQIRTPGLRWLILVNNRPLYPYLDLQHIVNPWGYGSFPVNIRLDLETRIEFAVRNESYELDASGQDRIKVHFVGGRIVGRYWYNPAYGDVVPGKQ